MRKEIHLIDGSVLVVEEGTSREDTDTTSPLEGREGRSLDPILRTLRSLRNKARRLGVWGTTLRDTEKAVINASLLLSRLGRRMRIVLEELSLKLRQRLRDAALEGVRRLGAESAATLLGFFRRSAAAEALLSDPDYLVYMGFRERAAHLLRV